MSLAEGRSGAETWALSVSEDSLPILDEHWKKWTEEKVSSSFEVKLKTPWQPPGVSSDEGFNRWLLVSATPEIEDGRLKWIWGCNTDIT